MGIKPTHVKNPLTLISIFSGISEISGNVMLPHIDNVINQRILIVFIVSFPALLVILFFVTLLIDHRVLYAPSDFRDERNFNLTRGSVLDKQEKIKEELRENKEQEEQQEQQEQQEQGSADSQPLKENPDFVVNAAEEPLEKGSEQKAETPIVNDDKLTPLEKGVALNKLQKDSFKARKNNISKMMMAEDLSLLKLSKELNMTIEQDVKIINKDSNKGMLLDGVGFIGNDMHVFEVKYSESMAITTSMFMQIDKIIKAIKSNDPSSYITVHFVFVTDKSNSMSSDKEKILNSSYDSGVGLKFHFFVLDELKEEFLKD